MKCRRAGAEYRDFGTPCHSSSSQYASHIGGFDVADDSTEPGNMEKVVYLLEDARLEVRVLYKNTEWVPPKYRFVNS